MNNQYIAGFTDADGCISFHSIGGNTRCVSKSGKIYNRKEGWAPTICLVNTNNEVLEEIKNYCNVGKIYIQNGSKINHSTTYRLIINKQSDIITFLKKINKFIVIKKVQSKYMIKFCESRKKRNQKRGCHIPYSTSELKYMSLVKQANMKGSFRSKDFRKIPFV